MKMDTRKPSLREMMNSESKNSMKNDLKVRLVTLRSEVLELFEGKDIVLTVLFKSRGSFQILLP